MNFVVVIVVVIAIVSVIVGTNFQTGASDSGGTKSFQPKWETTNNGGRELFFDVELPDGFTEYLTRITVAGTSFYADAVSTFVDGLNQSLRLERDLEYRRDVNGVSVIGMNGRYGEMVGHLHREDSKQIAKSGVPLDQCQAVLRRIYQGFDSDSGADTFYSIQFDIIIPDELSRKIHGTPEKTAKIRSGFQIYMPSEVLPSKNNNDKEVEAFISSGEQTIELRKTGQNTIEVVGVQPNQERFILGHLPKSVASRVIRSGMFETLYGRYQARSWIQIMGPKGSKEQFLSDKPCKPQADPAAMQKPVIRRNRPARSAQQEGLDT